MRNAERCADSTHRCVLSTHLSAFLSAFLCISLCIFLYISLRNYMYLHFFLHICLYFSAILHPSTCRSAYFSTCLCHMTLVYIALCISLYSSLWCFVELQSKVCVDTIEIRPAPKCLCRYNRNPTGADMFA